MATGTMISPAVTDELIREAERKIDLVEAGAASEFWAIMATRLRARTDMLRGQMTGLLSKVGRDAAVRLETIARLQGQIEENEDLLHSPTRTLSLFSDQLARMRDAQSREEPA